jgi:putative flippase GtrA
MTTMRWMPVMTPNRPAPHRLASDHEPAPDHELGQHVAWYVFAGAVTTGLQAVLFLALRPEFGATASNLVAVAITTIANTEFHRRVTFAGEPSSALRRHVQSVLTFAFCAGYGTVALVGLDALVAAPSAALEAAVLVAVSLVGGIARFVVLRWWVFAHHH